MTRLILIRHGQTDWNKTGRIQGQLDIPLNAESRRQIQSIISGVVHLKGVKRIDALYSSQLSRSWETAEGIGKIFKLKVKRLRELNELNQGIWQGLLEKQVMKRYKRLYNVWKEKPLATKPPKGESVMEACDRIIPAIQKIIARHKGQTICIVTHEIVSAIIKSYYKKIDMNKIWQNLPKNASWEVLEIKSIPPLSLRGVLGE
ncbi:MAG: histidine phosphatase family protein [Candidatus Omnitrophica bacterium]|nr:histidine phosphatase family protein [Candidatus Omnitrophota bacterium]